MKKANTEKRIEIEMIAERIKLLFAFCAELIPHKEMLEKVSYGASERSSLALGMAPIFGAIGQDWEAVHFQKKLEEKRARALYELINVLDETEKERIEFSAKQERRKAGALQIANILGI